MKNFIINITNFSLFIAIIISLFFITFYYEDPFKIYRKKLNFNDSNISLNRDFISVETFLHNFETKGYDSYVFGSSRTLGYNAEKWKTKLDSTASIFFFDASLESIYGIYSKIKFLNENKFKLKNCLIILDRDYSFKRLEKVDFEYDHLFVKHPKIAGGSYIKFYLKFFKAYSNLGFFASYYLDKFSEKHYSFMNGFIKENKTYFNPISNELKLIELDSVIDSNPDNYYKENHKEFYNVNQESLDTIQRINSKCFEYLSFIKGVFENHITDYRIIISPLYEQTKLNERDLDLLNRLFGSDKVFDFSGSNKYSIDKRNFYESSHYRKNIGNSILDSVYY